MSTNQFKINDDEKHKNFEDEKKERKTRTDCALCVELTQLYNELFCTNCEKEEKKRSKRP
jgi:hypothetical protein